MSNVKRFNNYNINESFNEYGINTSYLVDDIESLKRVNLSINRQMLISWFNEEDIDYFNMNDLEMYIMYIEKNENTVE